MTLRWKQGLCLSDNTVVGCVDEDAFNRGWWSYGCLEDWQDTKLGMHGTVAKAKKIVEQWVKANA